MATRPPPSRAARLTSPPLATVNVTGQVARLAFTAPAGANAGDTFAVTVSAIDTAGAVAPGYSSTVHFTSTDALAGLPARGPIAALNVSNAAAVALYELTRPRPADAG